MSECGPGSTLPATENLRPWLAEIARKYNIKTVNDCGCGDQWWVGHVQWKVVREKYDITSYEGVIRCDITKERTRDADLILCKDVLRHIDNEGVLSALKLFAEAAPYLVSDCDTIANVNNDKGSQQGRPIDLRKPPFSLGEPLEQVEANEQDKIYCLWRLHEPQNSSGDQPASGPSGEEG
jgi:hypothetical protein